MALHAGAASSSDACSGRAITAFADVEVSDGSSFRIEAYYHSKDAAAIRHIDDEAQVIAVEGPLGWARRGDRAQIGTEFHRRFALGHQYHALLLDFEKLIGNVRQSAEVAFRGGVHEATSGDYPYGGVAHLVRGGDAGRPAGLLFEFPEAAVISVAFHDWRQVGGVALPFHASIDDGEATFDYRYTDVDVATRSPLWFFDAVAAPPLDEVRIHRLHRKLLAAHCLGDAGLIAALSAPNNVIVSQGEVAKVSNADMRAWFEGVFERLAYTGYHDIAAPVIEVSTRSDVGWIAVNVRAVGSARESEAMFDDQWA